MNKTMISIAMTSLIAASGTAMATVCPVQVGEMAQYVEPKQIYDELKALDLTKSEYETAKEFEARVRESLNHETVATSHLLRATYFPDNLTYVAEREEFIIKKYAWANLGVGWDDVFGGWGVYDGKQLSKNPWGIERGKQLLSSPGSWTPVGRKSNGNLHGVERNGSNRSSGPDREKRLRCL